MLIKTAVCRDHPFLLGSRFLSVLVFLLALPACSSKPEPILRVATSVWPGYETLYLARSLGLYDKVPIRLVEMISASQVSHAIRNNTVEAATLTLDETLSLLQNNDVDLRVILIMDISNGGDALLVRSNIADLQGLRGKRIGVENNATGAIVLDAALQSASLKADDIEIIPTSVNDHLATWKNNKVDAIVTFEPIRSELLRSGAHELFNSSQVPGRILDVLVVRADALEQHEAALKALISGYFAGLNHLAQNPQDAAIRMAPRLALDAQQVMPLFKRLNLPSLADNRKWLSDSESVLRKTAAGLAGLMQAHQLLQGNISTELLADPKFLPETSQ